MSLHDPFVIAHAIEPSVQHMGGGAGLFLCISNIWMLLNVVRVINSGWNLRLFADVTYKPCQQAIAVMGFAVNSMGGKHHLVALSIIPDGGENAHYYGETWKGICASLFLLLREFQTCDVTTCPTCNAFRAVQEHPTVQEMLVQNPDYNIKNYQALPVKSVVCDCHKGFRKFAKDLLGLEVDSCFSHMAGNALQLRVLSAIFSWLTAPLLSQVSPTLRLRRRGSRTARTSRGL